MKTGSLEAVSNRATFQTERQMIDCETNQPIDLTGTQIVFAISCKDYCQPLLVATTENGKILFPDSFTYQVTFSLAEMRRLCAGTYDVGVTATRGGFTTQIIIGTLPVLDGDVS